MCMFDFWWNEIHVVFPSGYMTQTRINHYICTHLHV